MADTPILGWPIADAGEAPANHASHMQALGNAAEPYTVMRFTDEAERDALITSPQAGMFVWCDNPGKFFWHNGLFWQKRSTSGVLTAQGGYGFDQGAVGDRSGRFTRDQDSNWVHLEGIVWRTGATFTSNTGTVSPIDNMPDFIEPVGNRNFVIDSEKGVCVCRVLVGGTIEITLPGSNTVSQDQWWAALDGISYYAG